MRTKAIHRSATIAFCVMIALVPVIQVITEIRADKPISALEIFRKAPTAKSLKAFEDRLEDQSVIIKTLRPEMQAAQFLGLREAGEKAHAAADGWLFYQPGITYLTQRPLKSDSNASEAINAIAAFRDELARRDIQLIVMVAPNKESVYPDKFSTSATPSARPPSGETVQLLEKCRERDILTVNLFEVFHKARQENPAPLYLKQDSHWTPRGLAIAAEKLATLIPKTSDNRYSVKDIRIARHGDLVTMMKSPRIENSIAPETIDCQQVIDSLTGELYTDNPESDVLVLGDSFLRIFETDEPGSAGFIAHLAKAIGRPVSSIVNDGGASTLVRQELFRRPLLLKNKRYVIWEFVERDIRLGIEGWQIIPLPTPLPETSE